MTEWISFAGVTGGASAGLTGLTFIVVSFRFDTIAVSQELRSRAAQTLSLFLTVTVVAVLITVPQPLPALGVEMVLVAVASAVVLMLLNSAALREQTTRPSVALRWALAIFVGCIAVAGLLAVLGAQWGMYFYVVSAITGLVWGIHGAWTFLTRAGMHPSAEES